MPASMILANSTKKETIAFLRVPASKAAEIAGHPAAAAIVAWYLANNRGDAISFVSEYDSASPFQYSSLEEIDGWPDVTEAVVNELIAMDILRDNGKIYYFEGDIEVWDRDLENIWRADA